jgi:hypothetical protein
VPVRLRGTLLAAATYLALAVSWTWAVPALVLAVYQLLVWKTRTLVKLSYFRPAEALLFATLLIASAGTAHTLVLAAIGVYVLGHLGWHIRNHWWDNCGEIIWYLSHEDPTADKTFPVRLFGRTFHMTSTRRPRRRNSFDDFPPPLW